MSEAAFRRSGRLGDGHILMGSVDDARQGWARIEHYLAESGRTSEGFGRELPIGGQRTPLEMAGTIAQWRDAGGTHASIVTMGKEFRTAQAHIDYIAEVRNYIDREVSR